MSRHPNWGGARPNSGPGRQPGSKRWKQEQEKAGEPKPPPVPVAMPKDLPAEQSAEWVRLAPLALEARTLTPATADAFVELLEAIVLKRAMLAQVEAEGLTFAKVSVDGAGVEHLEPKAHPLLSRHAALMVRVENGRQRFRLIPMGKEIVPAKEAEADPFAAFDGPQLVKGGEK